MNQEKQKQHLKLSSDAVSFYFVKSTFSELNVFLSDMFLDRLRDEFMSLFVRVDTVVTEVSRVVLFLQKDRRDVDDRDLRRNRELKDLDVITLVPVRDELLVVAHPLHDILGI